MADRGGPAHTKNDCNTLSPTTPHIYIKDPQLKNSSAPPYQVELHLGILKALPNLYGKSL